MTMVIISGNSSSIVYMKCVLQVNLFDLVTLKLFV